MSGRAGVSPTAKLLIGYSDQCADACRDVPGVAVRTEAEAERRTVREIRIRVSLG